MKLDGAPSENAPGTSTGSDCSTYVYALMPTSCGPKYFGPGWLVSTQLRNTRNELTTFALRTDVKPPVIDCARSFVPMPLTVRTSFGDSSYGTTVSMPVIM